MLILIFGGGFVGLIVIIIHFARSLPSGGLAPEVKPSFSGFARTPSKPPERSYP